MKAKLEKLIDVKSIVTLVLTVIFCVLALCGVISGGEFLGIFTTVIAFYFGTQAQKRADAAAELRPAKEPEQATEAVEDVGEKTAETVDAAMYSEAHPDEDKILT